MWGATRCLASASPPPILTLVAGLGAAKNISTNIYCSPASSWPPHGGLLNSPFCRLPRARTLEAGRLAPYPALSSWWGPGPHPHSSLGSPQAPQGMVVCERVPAMLHLPGGPTASLGWRAHRGDLPDGASGEGCWLQQVRAGGPGACRA